MTPRIVRFLIAPKPGVQPPDGSEFLGTLNEAVDRARADLPVRVSDPIYPIPWQFYDADGNVPPVETSPEIDITPPAVAREIIAPPGPALSRFLERLEQTLPEGTEAQSDAALQSALWAPAEPFGTRRQARQLVGMDSFQPGNSAQPVHVVIVDQGFDRGLCPGQFGGGWGYVDRIPGAGQSEHAASAVRTLLDLVPGAILYDCPLIPTPAPGARPTVNSVPSFTFFAAGLWFRILVTLLWFRHTGQRPDSWVFINPWAIYDRKTDIVPRLYATDPLHILNRMVKRTVEMTRADVVFPAGNCGQFQPDIRCGKLDRGPCRSIFGVNSLDAVLTLGAVRTDTTWLGYSSQGKGQPGLGEDKPDLSAPSQFADIADGRAAGSGTSAACAFAGGVVAALRQQWGQQGVSPGCLKDALIQTARHTLNPDYEPRMGHGILDIAGVATHLPPPGP